MTLIIPLENIFVLFEDGVGNYLHERGMHGVAGLDDLFYWLLLLYWLVVILVFFWWVVDPVWFELDMWCGHGSLYLLDKVCFFKRPVAPFHPYFELGCRCLLHLPNIALAVRFFAFVGPVRRRTDLIVALVDLLERSDFTWYLQFLTGRGLVCHKGHRLVHDSVHSLHRSALRDEVFVLRHDDGWE